MDLQNELITIQEKSAKAGKYGQIAKVKGDNNKTYTVYELKKDGSTSIAWEQLQTLNIGDPVQVAFVDQDGEYEGKPYTSHIIRSFDLDIANGVKNAKEQQAAQPNTQDDEFWEKKGYKQCLWNYWIKNKDDLKQNWKDDLWLVFKEIEADADKRFATGMDKARAVLTGSNADIKSVPNGSVEPLPEELPTIQQEDINVEDIPFN